MFLTHESLTVTKLPSSFDLKNHESVISLSGMVASNVDIARLLNTERMTLLTVVGLFDGLQTLKDNENGVLERVLWK